ncbi:unnamed protein product [Orchesella dallaii]|uniref:Uncharacterized protein n=1 Tax=Orchesella dallaii TaxID=48710 RepID=A0ABP1RII5_9HEXA
MKKKAFKNKSKIYSTIETDLEDAPLNKVQEDVRGFLVNCQTVATRYRVLCLCPISFGFRSYDDQRGADKGVNDR